MALAVSLQHIALLTVELGDRAAMSAKAVTCCIRIFEVLEGTDILNADILDMLASTLMDDFASTSFAIVVAEYREILVLFDLQGYVASCSHRFSFTLIVPGPG